MLLVLGDSFSVKRYKQDFPWPEQLSKKLNLDLINLSMEGGGNDYMFRNFYEIVSTEKITHVVLALSNWDRLEIGIVDSSTYKNNKSKPKILKPKIVNNMEEKFLLKELLYDFYDVRYYYDKTLSQIISFQHICKYLNLKFRIAQLIQPFNKVSLNFQSLNVEIIQKHVNNCKMLPLIDQNSLISYELSFENIFQIKENDYLLYKFQKSNKQILDYVLGYHDLDLFYNNNYKNYKLFDFHPNHYGHSVIAEEVYESFNT